MIWSIDSFCVKFDQNKNLISFFSSLLIIDGRFLTPSKQILNQASRGTKKEHHIRVSQLLKPAITFGSTYGVVHNFKFQNKSVIFLVRFYIRK